MWAIQLGVEAGAAFLHSEAPGGGASKKSGAAKKRSDILRFAWKKPKETASDDRAVVERLHTNAFEGDQAVLSVEKVVRAA